MLALKATALCLLLLTFMGGCGNQPTSRLQLRNVEVEVACGQCQFNQPGSGCDLAIRHQNQVYFVVGSSIDDHGDAHAETGLCNAIRLGLVTGAELEDGKFQAESLTLLPDQGKK